MTAIITGSSRTRSVGELIDLTAAVTTGAGTLSDFEWEIKGKIVKGYTGPPASFRSGKVELLPESDKKNRTIKFHWIEEGTWEVKVKFKLDGTSTDASATFDVKRPKLKSFTSKTGAVADSVLIIGNKMGFMGPLAEPEALRGIVASAVVERNGAAAGDIAYIQLINWTLTFTPGVTLGSSGDFVLDGAAGKTKIFYWQLTKALSGSDATIAVSDGPSAPLTYKSPNATAVSDQNEFKLYLMYKSNDSNSIWVPIGLLNWHYKSKAKRASTSDPWALDGTPDIPSSPSGSDPGGDVTSFPEWSKYTPDLF